MALLSGLSGQALSPSLRAHAYITLGELYWRGDYKLLQRKISTGGGGGGGGGGD